MPAAVPAEQDDPVVASYDVYFTNTPGDHEQMSKLMVLQYPSHRAHTKPYNSARSQKPNFLRLKPRTGMVEVEIPIFTEEHYNHDAGKKFGQALSDSRVTHDGGSYGLARGFSNAPSHVQSVSLDDIPQHGREDQVMLGTQTLGGKIAFASERDPVYMLGSFRGNELHLSHMDAVVQMRPQLHHIDAEEEASQKKFQHSAGAGGKPKAGLEPGATKLETKAIELKLKDNKEDTKDRNLNENAKLLREIQREGWLMFDWMDQEDEGAWSKAAERLMLLHEPQDLKQLQSVITSDDWLDRMSAPREDGKKGLRSKLKGRDRERARRKKVEHLKRLANATATTVHESGLDDSDSSGHSDVDVVDLSAGLGSGDIKQETGGLAVAPKAVPSIPNPVPETTSPQRRRGRPRKETINNS